VGCQAETLTEGRAAGKAAPGAAHTAVEGGGAPVARLPGEPSRAEPGLRAGWVVEGLPAGRRMADVRKA